MSEVQLLWKNSQNFPTACSIITVTNISWEFTEIFPA